MAKVSKTFSDINITPLTDIFLVLLIIMMVVAPMLDTKALGLKLPELGQTAAAPDDEPQLIQIALTEANTISLDGSPTTLAGLAQALPALAKAKTEGALVSVAPTVPHGTLAAVLDALQQAQVSGVALQPLP